MSHIYDNRIAVLTIDGVEIPQGSDDKMTITRQPEVRLGAAVGNQTRPLEYVGDKSLEIDAPAGTHTVANRLLVAAAAACYAGVENLAGVAGVFKPIGATTVEGITFSGLGYVMFPTVFENANASSARGFKIIIPSAEMDASAVAATLATAGVV